MDIASGGSDDSSADAVAAEASSLDDPDPSPESDESDAAVVALRAGVDSNCGQMYSQVLGCAVL